VKNPKDDEGSDDDNDVSGHFTIPNLFPILSDTCQRNADVICGRKCLKQASTGTSPGTPTLHTPKANSKNYPVYCNRRDRG